MHDRQITMQCHVTAYTAGSAGAQPPQILSSSALLPRKALSITVAVPAKEMAGAHSRLGPCWSGLTLPHPAWAACVRTVTRTLSASMSAPSYLPMVPLGLHHCVLPTLPAWHTPSSQPGLGHHLLWWSHRAQNAGLRQLSSRLSQAPGYAVPLLSWGLWRSALLRSFVQLGAVHLLPSSGRWPALVLTVQRLAYRSDPVAVCGSCRTCACVCLQWGWAHQSWVCMVQQLLTGHSCNPVHYYTLFCCCNQAQAHLLVCRLHSCRHASVSGQLWFSYGFRVPSRCLPLLSLASNQAQVQLVVNAWVNAHIWMSANHISAEFCNQLPSALTGSLQIQFCFTA
jgi:hypothetical protein